MDPIDRELLAERNETPSALFAARVMAAVRRETTALPPLAFPWKRLVLGIAASLVWLVLGYRAVQGGAAPEVLALARSWPVLIGIGALVGAASLRFVRFCAPR